MSIQKRKHDDEQPFLSKARRLHEIDHEQTEEMIKIKPQRKTYGFETKTMYWKIPFGKTIVDKEVKKMDEEIKHACAGIASLSMRDNKPRGIRFEWLQMSANSNRHTRHATVKPLAEWVHRALLLKHVPNQPENYQYDTNVELGVIDIMESERIKKWRLFLLAIYSGASFVISKACTDMPHCRGDRNKWTVFAQMREHLLKIATELIYIDQVQQKSPLYRYILLNEHVVWPKNEALSYDNTGNWLYILWSPYSKLIYFGETTNLPIRHRDHFTLLNNSSLTTHWIPAYHAIKECKSSYFEDLTANFIMIPLAHIPGDKKELQRWEAKSLDCFMFKLNTPHVYRCLCNETLVKLRPDLGLYKNNAYAAVMDMVKTKEGGNPKTFVSERARKNKILSKITLGFSKKLARNKPHIIQANALLFRAGTSANNKKYISPSSCTQ